MKKVLLLVAGIVTTTNLNSRPPEDGPLDRNDPIVVSADGFYSVNEWNDNMAQANAERQRRRTKEQDLNPGQSNGEYIQGNKGWDVDHSEDPAGYYTPTDWGANGFETVEQQDSRMNEELAIRRRENR